jgi:hypothetical protein
VFCFYQRRVMCPALLATRRDDEARADPTALNIFEEAGRNVRRVELGNLVVMPFAYSDGSWDLSGATSKAARRAAIQVSRRTHHRSIID